MEFLKKKKKKKKKKNEINKKIEDVISVYIKENELLTECVKAY